MKYEKPQLFQPTPEEIERVAKYLNSKLTTKRVTSVNGVPVDKNGNIKPAMSTLKHAEPAAPQPKKGRAMKM
ncbi:MAG: hypothetical protein LBK47_05185 [Prevotellaceae bacterium]|jgi:hypothetical protein|nr:hypothetical protein [Prevotellaceae bacterium]